MFERIDASAGPGRGSLGRLRPPVATLALLLAASLARPTSADEIYFKSGYSQTAVVIRETEESVRFKTEIGMSTISREQIDFIETATEEENHALLKKWREKVLRRQEMTEARRDAERKYETEQLAKGNVKFESEWMTPERRQEILNLRKRAREHRRRFEAEQLAGGLVKFQHIWVTPEQEETLLKMETQVSALHDELSNQQKSVEAIRGAMLNVGTLDEADRLSQRIDELTNSMTENRSRLERLLKRGDEIEAASIRYEAPEKYLGVLESGAEFE